MTPVEVTCWRDRCAAFDAGEQRPRRGCQAFLGTPYRLVRFDPTRKRPSDSAWTQGVEALNQFSDGFPWLIISQASLDDLNGRLAQPLPMNRFRPNIVVDGLPAYGEDEVHELSTEGVTLRIVKACTRCAIPTTNQATAERESDEPLRTLRSYRFSKELRGVLFGQNAILIAGVGRELSRGSASLTAKFKSGAKSRTESAEPLGPIRQPCAPRAQGASVPRFPIQNATLLPTSLRPHLGFALDSARAARRGG